jgi:hypothetical protein
MKKVIETPTIVHTLAAVFGEHNAEENLSTLETGSRSRRVEKTER